MDPKHVPCWTGSQVQNLFLPRCSQRPQHGLHSLIAFAPTAYMASSMLPMLFPFLPCVSMQYLAKGGKHISGHLLWIFYRSVFNLQFCQKSDPGQTLVKIILSVSILCERWVCSICSNERIECPTAPPVVIDMDSIQNNKATKCWAGGCCGPPSFTAGVNGHSMFLNWSYLP